MPVWRIDKPASWSHADLVSSVSGPVPKWPEGENEVLENKFLRSTLGWKEPRGLKCYTHLATYPDLYVYFDHGDKTSPINEPATKAFKCYGLDGRQDRVDFDVIRGSCMCVRQQIPWSPGEPRPTNPLKDITGEEIALTFEYFRDKNPREIAQKRDMQRVMYKATGGAGNAPNPTLYGGTGMKFSPTGVQSHSCAACGLQANLRCSGCKSMHYCSKECQKSDWKGGHKATCKASK